MIDIIVEASISLFDSIMCIYFITKFNGSSLKKSKLAIPTTLAYFGITLLGDYFMTTFSVVISVILLILPILFALTICQGHYVRAVITTSIYKMMFILIASLLYTVFSLLVNDFDLVLAGWDNGIPYMRYVYVSIHKIALFAVAKFLVQAFRKSNLLEIKTGIYTLLISLITIVGLGASFMIVGFGHKEDYYLVLCITLAFILVNIIVYFLVYQVQKLQENKCELKLLQEKIKFEQSRHNDISVLWNNIRKVQHDMKQHLTVIAGQLVNNDIESCRTYVNELLPRTNQIGKLIKTGNSVLDYLLNAKLEPLQDTEVRISGAVADFNDIRDVDLACLMGNILDNAIEAVKDLPIKRIDLLFSMQNANRIIICRNTIEKSVLQNNHNLASTKSEPDQHGMGHLIINRIVSDYNGIVDYFEEDGMFGVEIILPLPKR